MRQKISAAVLMLCASVLASQAVARDGLDRRVLVTNATSQVMLHFYASNVGYNTWYYDILRDGVLEPGDSVVVDIDDGTGYCRYDFRAEFTGGHVATRYNVNACEVSSWTVYD